MKNRRQNDLLPVRVAPDLKRAVIDALAAGAKVDWSDPEKASKEMDKLLGKESKCDCLPGQCTKEAQYCKDWNKRGGK